MFTEWIKLWFFKSEDQNNYEINESNKAYYKTIFGKGVVASANKVLLDCQTRFARRLSYFAYDAQGNEIIGLKMVNEQWHHLHPRTVPFEAYQFVCSGKYDLHNFKHLDNLLRH